MRAAALRSGSEYDKLAGSLDEIRNERDAVRLAQIAALERGLRASA